MTFGMHVINHDRLHTILYFVNRFGKVVCHFLPVAITDNQSCLVCIARRISVTEKTPGMLGVEQFTTKQDLQGKILACDTRYVHIELVIYSMGIEYGPPCGGLAHPITRSQVTIN